MHTFLNSDVYLCFTSVSKWTPLLKMFWIEYKTFWNFLLLWVFTAGFCNKQGLHLLIGVPEYLLNCKLSTQTFKHKLLSCFFGVRSLACLNLCLILIILLMRVSGNIGCIYIHAHIYIKDYPSELYKKSRSFRSVFTCTLHFYNTLVVRELNYCKCTIDNYLGMIKE